MSKKKIGIIAAVVVLTAAASVTGLWLLQRGGGKGSGKKYRILHLGIGWLT